MNSHEAVRYLRKQYPGSPILPQNSGDEVSCAVCSYPTKSILETLIYRQTPRCFDTTVSIVAGNDRYYGGDIVVHEGVLSELPDGKGSILPTIEHVLRPGQYVTLAPNTVFWAEGKRGWTKAQIISEPAATKKDFHTFPSEWVTSRV